MSRSERFIILLRAVRELLESINQLIRTIRKNIQISCLVSAIIFLAGVATTIYLFAFLRTEVTPLLNLGPSLLGTAIASIPTKLILESRERMIGYFYLRSRCEKAEQLTEEELSELRTEAETALREVRKRG
jgi:hypothetical protein